MSQNKLLTISVPENFHSAVKKYCSTNDISVRDFLLALILDAIPLSDNIDADHYTAACQYLTPDSDMLQMLYGVSADKPPTMAEYNKIIHLADCKRSRKLVAGI